MNSMAQERIYRCGNEYTNTLTGRQVKDQPIRGTDSDSGTKPPAKSTTMRQVLQRPPISRVDSSEQKIARTQMPVKFGVRTQEGGPPGGAGEGVQQR
jgi:hypothetical protein